MFVFVLSFASNVWSPKIHRHPLQSDSREKEIIALQLCSPGGNSLSMDRDNFQTKPDVLEQSTWTVGDWNKKMPAIILCSLICMARTYPFTACVQLKSVSVCPFVFESVKLTKLTLRRCRSPLPKKKKPTPGFFFFHKNNCLKRSHGVECHQPMFLRGI